MKTNRSRWSKAVLSAMAALLVAAPAQAAKFSNQFIEFELPFARFKCALEGAEWVCQSEDQSKRKEAIIVLAAKIKGEQDSLPKYTEYLQKPRAFTSQGKPVTSRPDYVRDKTINAHLWVDSLHQESEVPGFFTRYLATVKEDIGVLVTYSVDKMKWALYEKDFEVLVNSIKVFRTPKKSQDLAEKDKNLFEATRAGTTQFAATLDPNAGGSAPAQGPAPRRVSTESGGAGLILLLALGAGGFFYWKKKQQGG